MTGEKSVRNRLLTEKGSFCNNLEMGRPKRAAIGGLINQALNRANACMTIFYKQDDYEAFEDRKRFLKPLSPAPPEIKEDAKEYVGDYLDVIRERLRQRLVDPWKSGRQVEPLRPSPTSNPFDTWRSSGPLHVPRTNGPIFKPRIAIPKIKPAEGSIQIELKGGMEIVF